MPGLNSKIGQSTVVIKTVCCFPRKALSSALLTVSRAAHVLQEPSASVQPQHGASASSARPHRVQTEKPSLILIRDYRWKLCQTSRDSDDRLFPRAAFLSSLGGAHRCSRISMAALTSALIGRTHLVCFFFLREKKKEKKIVT